MCKKNKPRSHNYSFFAYLVNMTTFMIRLTLCDPIDTINENIDAISGSLQALAGDAGRIKTATEAKEAETLLYLTVSNGDVMQPLDLMLDRRK